MRIGFITDSYRPRISGVVISIATMAARFREVGHVVHVVAPRVVGFADDEPHVHRLPSLGLPGHPDFPVFRPNARAVADFAVRQRLDIVHAHSPFLSGHFALAAARRVRAPVVFSHHTRYSEYVHYAPWIPASAARWMVDRHVRAFCARVDHVVAPSQFVRRLLLEAGVTTPVEAIPTGSVDLDRIARLGRMPRAAAGVPEDARLVVTASRLTPEKSVEDVLDAFAAMHPRTFLLVIGGGPLAGPLADRAAALGISARTRFVGTLPHEDVLRWLKAADLFLFASRTETQGMVIAEAMACGLPVVAVEASGVDEAVRHGETGLLTSAAELGRTADALLRDDTARAAMSARARDVVGDFARDRVADRLLALYRGLLGGPRAGG